MPTNVVKNIAQLMRIYSSYQLNTRFSTAGQTFTSRSLAPETERIFPNTVLRFTRPTSPTKARINPDQPQSDGAYFAFSYFENSQLFLIMNPSNF